MREFVDGLLALPHLADQVVYRHEIASSPAGYGELTDPLSPQQSRAAWRLGIDRLYSHQVEAIEKLRAGRDVAVVTPTASGKSLVYYLPTIERLSGEAGHALYLFPQKALEQDQLKKLRLFGRGLWGDRDLSVEIYDGDTSGAKRQKIRAAPPDVLITNPEMLHLGLLAYHGEWARFFSSLRLVVIDELHVYRGIFGNHFAHVIRRLGRVTRHYGSDPRYLAGSATIGNAASFTRTLLGRPFDIVSESGSPRAARHFLFVNPTGSPYTAATRLFTEAVRAGYRTIAFTKARRITELIHSWAVEAAPELGRRIATYRAGYLPEERREIERRLFHGDLRGVVATSALELGIDVGGLDVCILVGYPGSVMSAWQRIGRVGRQSGDSLVILVAQPDALDQYFMSHPREFFERGFEPAVVDPDNPTVAGAHLVCAGAELPVTRGEAEAYVGASGIERLLETGRMLQDEAGENFYSLGRRPQREVSLRSGGESYSIAMHDAGRSIGTIDGVRVFHECHEGAVYLHGGASYRVVELDRESKRVTVVPFRGDHYTQALGSKETEILETLRQADRPGYRLSLGRLKVTVRITEYAKKRVSDQQTISKHPLDVPPIVFETIGFWVTLPDGLERACVSKELHFMGGLHGSEHAMISLFPLLALCDRADVGGISYSRNPQLGAPAIFIYDGYPGGIGLATSVHDRIENLFAATRDLLDRCPCEEGCPSCVQSPKCGSGNRPLDKAAARLVLKHLTGEPVAETLPESPEAGNIRERAFVAWPTGDSKAVVRTPSGTTERSAGSGNGTGVLGEGPGSSDSGPRSESSEHGSSSSPPGSGSVRGERFRGAREAPPGPAPAGSRGAPPRVTSWRTQPSPFPARRFEHQTDPLSRARQRAFALTRSVSVETHLVPTTVTRDTPVRAAGGTTFYLHPDEGRVVVFDVETQRSAKEVGGWDRIPDMRLALAVLYDVGHDSWRTYYEPDAERLVMDLVTADRVIGYNSERFDFAVLSRYGRWDFSRIRSFDLMKDLARRLGFRPRLGDLAQVNLDVGKSADGLQSLEWFRQGRLDLIEEYCRRDVEVTARLFFLGRQRRYILVRHHLGAAVRLPVDW